MFRRDPGSVQRVGRASSLDRASAVGRSRRRLGTVAAGALVAAVGMSAWASTRWSADPTVQLSSAVAPPPSRIGATVETTQLRTTLVLRATLGLEGSEDQSVAASASSPDMIATSLPRVGSTIDEGSVVMTVNGHPVVALTGSLPMYRDLQLGLVGPDVDQLRTALVRTGDLATAPPPGTPLADEDLVAFERLVGRAGYALEPPDPDAATSVLAAELAVASADDAVASAAQALASAGGATGTSARAQEQYATAMADLDAEAQAALVAADSSARRSAVAKAALDDQQRALERRRAELPDGESADRTSIDADLRDIERQRTLLAVDAQDQQRQSAATLDGVARRRADALRSADAALAGASDEQSDLVRQLMAAERAATAARESLGDARRHAARVIPAYGVVYLAQLPRSVTGSNLKLGRAIEGPVVTVAGDRTVITADLTPSQVALVHPGDTAVFTSDVDGSQLTATVEQVRARSDAAGAAGAGGTGTTAGPNGTGTDADGTSAPVSGGSASQMEIVLVPDLAGGSAANGAVGAAGAVRIQSPATEQPELVVPSTAILLSADGRRTVSLLAGDASTAVEVVVIAEIDGRVAVRPTGQEAAALRDGVEVEVRSDGD